MTTSSTSTSTAPAAPERAFTFVGGAEGRWRVTGAAAVCGEPLPAVAAVAVLPGIAAAPAGAGFVLHGVTSNDRYVTRPEKQRLVAVQPPLGRPESTRAALIPIRKTAAWWALTQDERRRLFEEDSRHVAIGLDYLPAVARRLHHCRDLAGVPAPPFDFVTWFEFAPADAARFEDLLARLRASAEWGYVDREVDIRLTR